MVIENNREVKTVFLNTSQLLSFLIPDSYVHDSVSLLDPLNANADNRNSDGLMTLN